MEASVKATGYGELSRTNSVDVKNIAYHEQSDCHLDHGLPGPERPQIVANLVETRTQPRLGS
jgi:hypothetical protein